MATKRRPFRLTTGVSSQSPHGFDRIGALRRLSHFNLLLGLVALVGIVLLTYLATGHSIFLVMAALLTGAGTDGLIRTHPASRLVGLRDTSFYLFIPVLATVGAGIFFRYMLSGWWQLLGTAISMAMLGAVVYAEYESINADGERFAALRLILNVVAYLTAFSLYTSLYNQRLLLPIAVILVGLTSTSIGIEILHEVELKPEALVLYAGAVGFVMAEVRWALNFISLWGWLGGVFILVVFYLATQTLQSYLWGRMNRRAMIELSVVGSIGALLVLAGRLLAG